MRFDGAGGSTVVDPFLGHNILDHGIPVPNQPILDFTGDITVTDDSPGTKTIVSLLNTAQPAYTTLTTDFTQPSGGGTVTVTVGSTAWMAIGANLFIESGGYYAIANILSSTTLVLLNLGYSGINAKEGEAIASGNKVMSSGVEGPAGLPGTVSATSGVVLTSLAVAPLAQAGRTVVFSTTSEVVAMFSDGSVAFLNGPQIDGEFYNNVIFDNNWFSTTPGVSQSVEITLNTAHLNTTNVPEGDNLYFTPTRAIDAITSAGLLGSAASGSVGTDPLNLVQLDDLGRLPAVDGSQLTGIRHRIRIRRDGILHNDRAYLNFLSASITDNPSDNELIIDTGSAIQLDGHSASYFLNRANHTNKLPLSALDSGGATFGQILSWNGSSFAPITASGNGNGASIGNALTPYTEVMTADFFYDKESPIISHFLDPNGQNRQFVLDPNSYVGQFIVIRNLNPTYKIEINDGKGQILWELSSMSALRAIQINFDGSVWHVIGTAFI